MTIILQEVGEKAKQAMIYELSSHIGAGAGATGASQWNRQVGDAIDFIAVSTGMEAIVKVGLVNSQNDFDVMYKSMLIDYGTGDMMSDANPFLNEYLSSDLYNSNRENRVIRTRPGDQIYDPEIGSWRASNAKGEPYDIPQFSQPSTYFFENGMRLIVSDFNSAIDRFADSFDFGRFLIVK